MPLRLSYALQYAHNLKEGDNNLIISLERPKRCDMESFTMTAPSHPTPPHPPLSIKHRPVKGYKTLCRGIISLSAVLQKDMVAQDLRLVNKSGKEMAVVAVKQVTSAPADPDAGVPYEEDEPDTDDSLSDHMVRGQGVAGSNLNALTHNPLPAAHRRRGRTRCRQGPRPQTKVSHHVSFYPTSHHTLLPKPPDGPRAKR